MRTRVLLGLAFIAAAGGAVVLDRVAVTVGKDVITDSEILDEIRVTAFLNGEEPAFSAEVRRRAAERLVDQALIRRDMNVSRYPEPENSEADKLLAQFKRMRFQDNNARYEEALKKYEISEADLKAHLLWQLAALRFTDYRFQPGVPTVSQGVRQQLEQKQQQRSAQEAAGRFTDGHRGGPAEGRADGAGRAAAVPWTVDQQLDAWLKQARSQTRIRFRQEAFE